MKAKLLKKLRNRGRNAVNIISVTKTGDTIIGMSYGYDEDDYKGLFNIGDTEYDVKEKAARIYIKNWLKNNKQHGKDI